MQFNLVRRDGAANLTFVVDGNLYPVDDSHPDFDEIVEAVLADDTETAVHLFDASHRAAARFENLSDRVTVANSRVYVDQTEVDDVYADQIVRFLDEGVEDFKPLVNFLEKVYSNVSEGIRENLSRWLKAEQFTILPNGNILGYRGLNSDYTSKHAGPGIVNGEQVNGHLDNSVGNVVELPASLVEENARLGCASGLHVGTYNYANGWAGYGGVVVSVEVDPRHVRSVPYECDSQKMRVSKYTVKETVTVKKDDTVYSGYDYDPDEYDEYGEDAYGDYCY
jgi:hypothetical protein